MVVVILLQTLGSRKLCMVFETNRLGLPMTAGPEDAAIPVPQRADECSLAAQDFIRKINHKTVGCELGLQAAVNHFAKSFLFPSGTQQHRPRDIACRWRASQSCGAMNEKVRIFRNSWPKPGNDRFDVFSRGSLRQGGILMVAETNLQMLFLRNPWRAQSFHILRRIQQTHHVIRNKPLPPKCPVAWADEEIHGVD